MAAEDVLPLLRLVVAAEEVLPVERLLVLLVERLVLPLWRLELEELLPVRVFWAMELAERDAEGLLDRLELVEILAERLAVEEPPDRLLMEEEPREVVCEEDDRVAVEAPPEERRDWAFASGAAIIAIVMKSAATVLIILLMALSFKS